MFAVDESPHVHFPADQVQAHDAEIVVQSVGDKQLDIHLGFLQIHHHYQVQLVIKDKLSEDLKFDPLQNLNVSILEAVPTDDGKLLYSLFVSIEVKLLGRLRRFMLNIGGTTSRVVPPEHGRRPGWGWVRDGVALSHNGRFGGITPGKIYEIYV